MVHKQTTIMGLLKPILKNLGQHAMSCDMENVVTIDMIHNAETLWN